MCTHAHRKEPPRHRRTSGDAQITTTSTLKRGDQIHPDVGLKREGQALAEGVVEQRVFQHAAEEDALFGAVRVGHYKAAAEAARLGRHHALEDNILVDEVEAQRRLWQIGVRRDRDEEPAADGIILPLDPPLLTTDDVHRMCVVSGGRGTGASLRPGCTLSLRSAPWSARARRGLRHQTRRGLPCR